MHTFELDLHRGSLSIWVTSSMLEVGSQRNMAAADAVYAKSCRATSFGDDRYMLRTMDLRCRTETLRPSLSRRVGLCVRVRRPCRCF
jgi:hypothetical protein